LLSPYRSPLQQINQDTGDSGLLIRNFIALELAKERVKLRRR
jgi:hypothetical protein